MVVFLIKQYQRWISPFLSPCCRFYPTCSEYARGCFENHRFFKALTLSMKRFLRCHPYCEGGMDLLP